LVSHPYAALPERTLGRATVITAGAWALLTLLLVWAVPLPDLGEVQSLVSADHRSAARAILKAWTPGLLVSFSFLLGFDFLYDLVHNNAVALFAVWGAAKRGSRSARRLAGTAAWLLWLATGLNVFENMALLHVVRSGAPEPLLPLASAVFAIRSALLAGGIVVGVGLHASAWLARRPTSR
jgi:hypothetical protein